MSDAKIPLTVLVAAKNEEANMNKCLQSLTPADRVIVLDSYSTDDTRHIAESYGAEVVDFAYSGGYPKKRQWALNELGFSTEWILLLDADEVVPRELWDEIRRAIASGAKDAYLIRKGFHFMGRRFKHGGFSHAAVLLFKNGCARFEELIDDPASAMDMEVHERVLVAGEIGQIPVPLIHEDFKGLEAYIDRHNKYSTWEARLRTDFLRRGSYGKESIQARLFGNSQERRRFLKKIVIRIPFESAIWFIYHYVIRLGILEGRPGLIACRIRAAYISQVRAKMYELRQQEKELDPVPSQLTKVVS